MSLMRNRLPEAKLPVQPMAFQFDAPSDLLEMWAKAPPPKAAADDGVIDVFDVIGEDFWGEGVTAKAVAGRLSAAKGDVKVRINSPGGNVFEGMSIYNLLRAHDAKVTVEVYGIAASAASIIAMAGDEIVMGPGTMLMVHNAWGVVVGNRHDLREAADVVEKIDGSMARLYAGRTGRKTEDVAALMDAETFMSAEEAVAEKFADRIDGDLSLSASLNEDDASPLMARRALEASLARAGVSRKNRAEMISRAMEGAAPRDASRPNDAARDAGMLTKAQLDELAAILHL